LINKLIRIKSHWERRIVELGGRNHHRRVAQGQQGAGGYLYFGAAKKLNSVQAFEKEREAAAAEAEKKENQPRSRHELYQLIDCDYYGFRDEDDGVLVQYEREAEKQRDWVESGDDDLDVFDIVVPNQQQIEKQMIEEKKKTVERKIFGSK